MLLAINNYVNGLIGDGRWVVDPSGQCHPHHLSSEAWLSKFRTGLEVVADQLIKASRQPLCST